jgi:hypothetical protein
MNTARRKRTLNDRSSPWPTHCAPTSPDPDPEHADDVLEDVRQDISADDKHLREVRDRRNLVTAAAKTFGQLGNNTALFGRALFQRPKTWDQTREQPAPT